MFARIVLMGCVFATACAGAREVVSLDGTWSFRKIGATDWTEVTVPHDWAIEGPYLASDPGNTGKLPWVGKGEYVRKVESAKGQGKCAKGQGKSAKGKGKGEKSCFICFDGVMARPQVFVNGTKVGGWDYGYMSFVVDATAAMRAGENELRVTADTTKHKSRWYPGAGIYRSVRMVVAEKGEAVPGTVAVETVSLSKEKAVARATCRLVGGGEATREFTVANPRLWDVDDPYLYTFEVCGEKVRYGFRTAVFTADDGFHLNGRRVQLKGVNLHADLGPLGMAFDRDAMKRQLLIMRDMGVNALRTSHNPPAPQVLDLCDELGIVVWDECFDKWNGTAGIRPYENVDEYLLRNMLALVRRDRNHPSVVAWSIGNEMRLEGEPPDGNVTPARVKTLADAVRAIDRSRPVAAGCDLTEMVGTGCWDSLDLTGWNYGRRYEVLRARNPKMPLVYSESASAYSDYGFYGFPQAAYRDDYHWADRKTDSYDHTSAPWSDIPDSEFWRMETDRYVAGEFVWTGLDYLGEPCPYQGPEKVREIPNHELARSSYFGICDLCGVPKDRFYLYRAHWNNRSETCHLVPAHWNFARALKLPVYVYTSGDSAELFLNGRSLGRRAKTPPPADYDMSFEGMDVKKYPNFRENPYYRVCDRYRLRWFDVPYEPGELKAVCYRDGKKIGEDVIRTAGAAAAIRLTRDPYSCGRLTWVQVDLVDGAGTRLPRATDRVTFVVEGPARIVATGSGDARDYEPFPIPSRRLYYGKACAAVRRTGDGPVVLKACVPGLAEAKLGL